MTTTIRTPTTMKLRNALLVLVLAPATRAWLAEHDPKALAQAHLALADLPDATLADLSPEVRRAVHAARNTFGTRGPVDLCPICGEDRNHPSQHGNHRC